MQQNLIDWTQQCFAHTPDYVLLFSSTWERLWQNKECPLLPPGTESKVLQIEAEKPQSCTGTLCYAGELHSFQFDVIEDDNVYFLVRIMEKSYPQIGQENADWWNLMQNDFVMTRTEIFGISNAVNTIYNIASEFSDDYPELMQEHLPYLDIIQGNCCRLMQRCTLLTEQSRYYQSKELEASSLFLDLELSSFERKCRRVFGLKVKTLLYTEDYLSVFTNSKRLEQALLCAIRLLYQRKEDVTTFKIEATASEDSVIVNITAIAEGNKNPHPRHSRVILNQTESLHDPLESILHLFCKTYHVTMITSQTADAVACSLRFPLSDMPDNLVCRSNIKMIEEDIFSIYNIMLADISEYRFY